MNLDKKDSSGSASTTVVDRLLLLPRKSHDPPHPLDDRPTVAVVRGVVQCLILHIIIHIIDSNVKTIVFHCNGSYIRPFSQPL